MDGCRRFVSCNWDVCGVSLFQGIATCHMYIEDCLSCEPVVLIPLAGFVFLGFPALFLTVHGFLKLFGVYLWGCLAGFFGFFSFGCFWFGCHFLDCLVCYCDMFLLFLLFPVVCFC